MPILIDGMPYFLRGQLAGILKGMKAHDIQNRNNLNENGDLISHLDMPGVDIGISNSELGTIDYEVFELLNEFDEYATGKGANVVLSYPSLYDKEFDNWKEGIDELDKLLKEKTTVDIISDYKEYQFTREEIFDSVYHLNRQGRQRRTAQLIEDLEEYLN